MIARRVVSSITLAWFAIGALAAPTLARADADEAARIASAAFGGLCATRTPTHAHRGCARIALAIAAAPSDEAAARLERAVGRLVDVRALHDASDRVAAADAQVLAAAITALALDASPDLSTLADALGPSPDAAAVAQSRLHAGAVRDPLAAIEPSPAPQDVPGDPHAGYSLQPLLPPDAPDGASRPADPLADYKAQMAAELRRNGLPVPPEFLPAAAPGLGTRACGAFADASLGGTPLGFADVPLPQEIAGVPGDLHAVLLMGGVALPVPLLRSETGLRIAIPFHLGDWRAGGTAALVVYHALAMERDGLACAPVAFRIAPAEVTPGAFDVAADAVAALPERLADRAEALALPVGATDALAAALEDGLAPLRAAYEAGDAETRDRLDALAPLLRPQPLVAALDALETAIPAVRQRDGRFERLGARIVPAQTGAGRGVAPSGGRVCPEDARQLAAWSDLHLRAEIASRPEMQNLLIGSQILAGTSIGLFGTAAGLVPGLAANAPGAMAGLAYATWGIFVDYLDKTLPARSTALLARVDRDRFTEDDADPTATLLEAVLVTESKGWDPSKATVDLLLGFAGFLGLEGQAVKLGRAGLQARYATQVGKLTDRLMPTVDEQADLVAAGFDGASSSAAVADTAENLAASFAGWLGGDLASAPLRDELPSFTIAPQTCRTDILEPGLEPGFSEVRLQQVIPESFVLDEGPPYRARALHWGEADLLVFPGTRLWRLRQVDASIRLVTPRTQILLGLPAGLQPGDAATLTAEAAPPVEGADYGWAFDGAGVVAARRDATGSAIAIETSRRLDDFPIEGAVTLEAPRMLPPRHPDDRVRRFAIGATALGLRPEATCAEPGDSVRIHAFDGTSGAPVDPRDLVFRTIGGGRVAADGTLTDIPPGRDPIIVRARGVGANGYAGETQVARGCACGASVFDPDLVAGAPLRAGGVETLTLRGGWRWWTTGDYTTGGATEDTAIRLAAYDHRFLAGNSLQFQSTCTYQIAGLSAGMLPFETYFSREGPLFVLDEWPDGMSPTQAAIMSGGVDVAGEDLDGDGGVDPSRNADDALFFTHSAPGTVRIERLSRDRLVVTVAVPMTGRGDRVTGRRPTGQPIEEPIERQIVYHARFETSLSSPR